MNPDHKPPLLANAPCPGRASSSNSRLVKFLIWIGGGLLLVFLVVEIIWVRSWLQRQRATGAAAAPSVQALLPSGPTAAGQGNYAGADSISITFSHPVVEQGIQLLILPEDLTTPAVI